MVAITSLHSVSSFDFFLLVRCGEGEESFEEEKSDTCHDKYASISRGVSLKATSTMCEHVESDLEFVAMSRACMNASCGRSGKWPRW